MIKNVFGPTFVFQKALGQQQKKVAQNEGTPFPQQGPKRKPQTEPARKIAHGK